MSEFDEFEEEQDEFEEDESDLFESLDEEEEEDDDDDDDLEYDDEDEEESIEEHMDNNDGYCLKCKDWTRIGDTEPEAEDYECPECENNSCIGAEIYLYRVADV